MAKKTNNKNILIELEEAVEEIKPSKIKKRYEVVIATNQFFVINTDKGYKTIMGINNHKKGDIVNL